MALILFVLGIPTDGEGESLVRCLGPPPPLQQWHPTRARRGARWCRAGLGSSGSWGEVLVTGPPVCCLSGKMCMFFFITACVCILYMFVCACKNTYSYAPSVSHFHFNQHSWFKQGPPRRFVNSQQIVRHEWKMQEEGDDGAMCR